MALDNNRSTREYDKFKETPVGGKTAVRVCADASDPIPVAEVSAVVPGGTPIIRNVTVGTTESTFSFTSGTKRFAFKIRGNAVLYVGTSVGSTTAGPFFTLEVNSAYEEDNLNVTAATLYIRSDKSGQTLEIWEWI